MDILSTSSVIYLFFFTIAIVYIYIEYYAFGYWKSRRVPYVKSSFPFGNVGGVGRKYHCTELLKKWYDQYKPTGAKLVGVYLFATPVAIVLDLKLVKTILNRDFWSFDEKIEYFDEINEPIGARLSHLHGEKWKSARAKLTPAFSSAKMKAKFQIVAEVGERLCAGLTETIEQFNGDEVDIYDWCIRYAADNMGLCVFGIECDSLKDPNSEFITYARRMGLYTQHSPLFLAFLNGFESVGRFFRIKTIPTDVSAFVLKTVADTIEYRRANAIHRGDFLDTLIGTDEKGKQNPKSEPFTFDEVVAHTMSFFLGSFTNSLTNLTFCLYELSINPDIQTKARHIIEAAFRKYNGQFTYEMMMDLPYIDQIIEETLRKYSISIMTRMAKKDYAIDDTDIVIAKGTRLIIPMHAIHMDPEYYPQPERWDPDRFESNVKHTRDPIQWLSFGSGPRFCIGQRFAMIQTRVAIVLLLKSFELSLGSKTTVPLAIEKQALLLTPQNGVHLKLKLLK